MFSCGHVGVVFTVTDCPAAAERLIRFERDGLSFRHAYYTQREGGRGGGKREKDILTLCGMNIYEGTAEPQHWLI